MKKKLSWRLLLLPFALLYSAIAWIRNKLYDWQILPSRSGVLPTIIIGNLTVGGTGKTPMTIHLARMLKDEHSLAILSRGYKRRSKGCLVSDYKASYRLIGDEPKLISMKTGLPIAVCADRLHGLELIKKQLPDRELVILDDGLQHRRLKGDVNILLIDYNRQVFDDFFLPAGYLRDNRYRTADADIIVFTKCPKSLSQDEARQLIKRTGKEQDRVFFTSIFYQHLVNYYTNKSINFSELKNYKLLVISGLAKNADFVNFLSGLGQVIEIYSFADHKDYKFAELEKIFYNFGQIYTKNGLIITTDKDFVKITEFELDVDVRSRLFVLPIDVDFLFSSDEKFKSKILEKWKKTCS